MKLFQCGGVFRRSVLATEVGASLPTSVQVTSLFVHGDYSCASLLGFTVAEAPHSPASPAVLPIEQCMLGAGL